MNESKIMDEFFKENEIFVPRTKRLFVLLGAFVDFDSFEYAQQLSLCYEKLRSNSIRLFIIGIGSEKSKEYFCRYNNLVSTDVFAVKNSALHEKLNLNSGTNFPVPPIINLMLMCAGINSPGTIKEVFRGYSGDRNSKAIFDSNEEIKIGKLLVLSGSLFDIISHDNYLRPFELATRRLLNMIEIISNWRSYVNDTSFLTQRGATFLVDDNDDLLYKFVSKNLLGYSENMNSPLSYLDKFLT